jgi:hypothetical protein
VWLDADGIAWAPSGTIGQWGDEEGVPTNSMKGISRGWLGTELYLFLSPGVHTVERYGYYSQFRSTVNHVFGIALVDISLQSVDEVLGNLSILLSFVFFTACMKHSLQLIVF